jgi:transposase
VGGREALRSAGPTGPAPRLLDAHLAAIDRARALWRTRPRLRHQPLDLDRITTVIHRVTGVAYHPGHVWELLRHRLHYRLLRPARRAVERDEQAIARWVAEDWP